MTLPDNVERDHFELRSNRVADYFMINWLGVYDPVHHDLFNALSTLPLDRRREYVAVAGCPDACDEESLKLTDEIFAEANEGDELARRLLHYRAGYEWHESHQNLHSTDVTDPIELGQLTDEYLEESTENADELTYESLDEVDDAIEAIERRLLATGKFTVSRMPS